MPSRVDVHLVAVLMVVLVGSVCGAVVDKSRVGTSSCGCADESLCVPVGVGGVGVRESFFFDVSDYGGGYTAFEALDWSASLTTIVQMNGAVVNTGLLCKAHANGVRVLLSTSYNGDLLNATERELWVAGEVQRLVAGHADGVNVDYERPLASTAKEERVMLTGLVANLTRAVKQALGEQALVAFDAAWSPACIDGRCYDFEGIAKVVDVMFVMFYDMQSQIFPPRACAAYANSPYDWITGAVNKFVDAGVPVNKLILGVPFYGYNYACVAVKGDVCMIKSVPFRGCNCSDAAGSQHSMADVLDRFMPNATSPVLWDEKAQSPYFFHSDGDGTPHQMRFDNDVSLLLKFKLAKSLGMRGIGSWTINFLPYGSPNFPAHPKVVQAIWDGMAEFLQS